MKELLAWGKLQPVVAVSPRARPFRTEDDRNPRRAQGRRRGSGKVVKEMKVGIGLRRFPRADEDAGQLRRWPGPEVRQGGAQRGLGTGAGRDPLWPPGETCLDRSPRWNEVAGRPSGESISDLSSKYAPIAGGVTNSGSPQRRSASAKLWSTAGMVAQPEAPHTVISLDFAAAGEAMESAARATRKARFICCVG
jgi:hypothetical protein